MLRKLRDKEQGFTLIELLVVILIIGILAAIALPTFLGQQKKAQDTEAKTNARNLVTHVESCYADSQSYASCGTQAALGTTGLPWGSGQGQVSVTAVSATTYTIVATSKSSNTFTIARDVTAGTYTRTCTGTSGGCKNSSW
jgi:type IV pilus assembly protein PilA